MVFSEIGHETSYRGVRRNATLSAVQCDGNLHKRDGKNYTFRVVVRRSAIESS